MNENGLALKRILVREKRRFAELIQDRQVGMDPEYWKGFSPSGREAGIQDAEHHLDFLTSAIIMDTPELFVEYAVWVKELFDRLGFPEDTVEKTLWCIREVLGENLSEMLAEMTGKYIDRAAEAAAGHEAEARSFLEGSDAMAKLRRLYVDAVLQGNRAGANTLVLTAADEGAAIGDIYLNILQPAQYEIGRLWQTGTISVAKEHFCTAVTQEIMARLYPRITPETMIGKKALIACASGELHQIGARMIADLLEIHGWDSIYIGANTPTRSILQAMEEYKPDVVGLSVTLSVHLPVAEDIIRNIRGIEGMSDVKILVGGHAFASSPDLWRGIGADAYSTDAEDVVKILEEIV